MSLSFEERLNLKREELFSLFGSLYSERTEEYFNELLKIMEDAHRERSQHLYQYDEKKSDANGDWWYQKSDMVGYILYVDRFGKNLKGVTKKLGYLKELGVRYLHLMPILDMPPLHNDGGYAVSDFRSVFKPFGTIEDLAALTAECRQLDISVCLDFVANHTSDEHRFAKEVLKGNTDFEKYYFVYDSDEIPKRFEETMPQVFPSTAPGNITYIESIGKYVMTTFYPYQWDLNYANPEVFNFVASDILFLANKGIDIFRIDATPYIWKELGTTCRNLPQVHTITRMIRLICEIVCPAVILKGEIVMAPHEVAPYFGTESQPECHLLYNVTGMVNIWNSLATRDTRPLRRQMEQCAALPKQNTFINYVRCHDDIGWGLDEDYIRDLGFDPLEHKKFLYNFYIGNFPGSFAKGQLYNFDPVSMDARSCGMAASLCGIEEGILEDDRVGLLLGELRLLLIYGVIFAQSGIPTIYSGDEVAAMNDYSYEENPLLAVDSRNLHRGSFDEARAKNRFNTDTVEGRIFTSLQRIIELRSRHRAFDADANVSILKGENHSLLEFIREKDGERILCLFNFSEGYHYYAKVNECMDLLTGKVFRGDLKVKPYEFFYLKME